jgi:hypothetical protein
MHAYFFAKAKHSILEYGKNLSADLNSRRKKNSNYSVNNNILQKILYFLKNVVINTVILEESDMSIKFCRKI